ncbi:MAG: SRPBCC family protein [Aeromicrobium sp.]|uniref:SRPBCC family protein n=1 Tax=Aeromicrobium sp. TaxID=1871063 RepID=UPI0039E2D2AE
MRFEKRVRVAATPEQTWQIVGDPLRLGGLSGRLEVEELGEAQTPGAGARYRTALHVGAVPLGSTVEVVDYREARDLAWVTLTGIDHRFRVMVRPKGSAESLVTMRFAYDSPGLIGTAADVVAFLPVRAAMLDLLDRVVAAVTD